MKLLKKMATGLTIQISCLVSFSFAQDTTHTLPGYQVVKPVPSGFDSLRPGPPDSSQSYYRLNGSYLKSVVQDLVYVVKRPVHWQQKDWQKFSTIAIASAGIFAADWEIRKLVRANQNNTTTNIARIVEPFGNTYGLYLFPAIYVAGVLTKQRRVESLGLTGAKSLAISTVIYTLSKQIVRRKRPDATDSHFNYVLPFTGKGYTSSPSGHSNTIFTVATVLAMEYSQTKWVPPLAYGIATATALSRVYDNRHWASDIVFGSLLGHFVTKAVMKHNQGKARKKLILN
jgi:membrane-associated phospholipid phosphatase